ncbi:hypothetical protein [Colwellia hornerae]|uniref:DUF805 domain-containing protein n=1 Tax=Colwellia hornerae TaxID=89402 RepID=A0A5C6QNT3_9GAMM|nr:hypothetical protein [Colwellia hornerae]TWX54587.1 hypothetical protein ESZ28_07665 [Colwellia hornerae]TWX61027.1 hypothetical protein ESZ26_06440 [Colwellia hornerae]TWX70280.1 hypothetical protein ESZ27_03930 [Colwellia hornerae]
MLKSLFCLTGSDDRRRFIAIHLSCYLLFIITSTIFSFNGLLSLLALSICAGICTLSTKRRLNDANLKISWLLAPTASFLIAGLIITISDNTTSYWLLLVPLAISAFLMTYKSQKNNHIFGYAGHIDLSSYIKQGSSQPQQRIEPTFNQHEAKVSLSSAHQGTANTYVKNSGVAQDSPAASDDIGEAIRLKLLNNKHKALTLTILILIVLLAIVLPAAITSVDDDVIAANKNEKTAIEQSKSALSHEVTLPDNFSLLASSFDGITIKWQGDQSISGFLWQQTTAQGDNSCQVISYDNGEVIRTLDVNQESNGDYLARFSPLDTRVIIKNIAIRSSFTLCGYTFSLNGSQAILGKHRYYSTFLEQ